MTSSPRIAPAARPAPRSRLTAPRVSVVVVNYCQWRHTDRLITQLADAAVIDAGLAETIVLDNDSPPDPAMARVLKGPGVSLRRFDRNTGFARAVNEGCRLARGEWVLLLNPDTAVGEGFLDQLDALCRSLEDDDPRIGVAGPALKHADGSDQSSCGPPPTLGRTLSGLLQPRGSRRCLPLAAEDRVAVPWVTGCGMLIRRSCWAELGGFDESFFLYYEDADFCERAWRAGWSVWYEPSLTVTHFQPLHTRPVPPELRLMTRHALLTYARKHWGGWRSLTLSAIVWAEALLRQTRAAVAGASSDFHGELRRLAGDWLFDRPLAARERIRRAASQLANCAGREDTLPIRNAECGVRS